MKLAELKKAKETIDSFCKETGAVIVITNGKGLDKGIWTSRMTRKSVQVFYLTGESVLDVTIKTANKCVEMALKTGIKL